MGKKKAFFCFCATYKWIFLMLIYFEEFYISQLIRFIYSFAWAVDLFSMITISSRFLREAVV